jgi:hypothetical protein
VIVDLPLVSLDLCVRLGAEPAAWGRALEALWAWREDLTPVAVDELTTPGAEPRAWAPEDTERLAALLGGDTEGSWELAAEEAGGAYALRGRAQSRLTLAFRRPATEPPPLLSEAVRIVGRELPVGLAMAFDPASDDAELIFAGIHALGRLAPVTYLDAISIDLLGGGDHVARAPCPVTRVGAGMVLAVRSLDCHDAAAPCMVQAEAVAAYLSLAPDSPVSLLPR